MKQKVTKHKMSPSYLLPRNKYWSILTTKKVMAELVLYKKPAPLQSLRKLWQKTQASWTPSKLWEKAAAADRISKHIAFPPSTRFTEIYKNIKLPITPYRLAGNIQKAGLKVTQAQAILQTFLPAFCGWALALLQILFTFVKEQTRVSTATTDQKTEKLQYTASI